ncbi:MAG: DMT family transporter, partial [Bacteroidetes bacterium]|nr:DMT family transporter [Bacteroidota bacterium]
MIRFIESLHPYLLLIILTIVWGASFILIKKGLVAYSWDQLGSIRIFLSFVAFLPYVFIHLKSVKRRTLLPVLGVGLFGSGIPAFLFGYAQTVISSSLAGIINSMTPLFTLLLGVMLFSVVFNWIKVLGVAVGFVGAAALILFGEADLAQNFEFGGFAILATICYAASGNIIKHYLQDMNGALISAIS